MVAAALVSPMAHAYTRHVTRHLVTHSLGLDHPGSLGEGQHGGDCQHQEQHEEEGGVGGVMTTHHVCAGLGLSESV